MSVTVEGVLVRDAVSATFGADIAAVIVFLIDPGKGKPFEIRYRIGTTAESHINAENIARGMRKGAYALATSAFIETRIDHGEAVFCMREPFSLRVNNKQLIP